MKKTLAALSLATLVALAGCAAQPAAAPASRAAAPAASAATSGDVLASLGLAGLSGKQIVEKIDQDPTARPLKMKASVRPDKVIVGNGTAEVSVPIADSFYLSVAPYAVKTHECFYHSLATCNGEMNRKKVHVTIADASGKVLVDSDSTTYANGFVGFWLPKNIKGTVTVTADGRTGTVPFGTGAEDPTCLTTLQVA